MIHRLLLPFGLLCSFLVASAAAQTERQDAPESPPDRWKTKFYGFAEFDAIHDSTQSFTEASLNAPIFPRGTYQGDNGRTQFTAKNSRLGVIVDAPSFGGITATAHINFDFFGAQATELTENDYYVVGTMRLRHAYLKLRTPIVDVLAGQHPTLFGWGNAGFYPGTVAFLGTVGQVYDSEPQLRLSRVFGDQFIVEPAVAALRPAQREAEMPDVEFGLRLAYKGRIGRTIQGNDRPEVIPLSIGLSGLYRKFAVNEYRDIPRHAIKTTGWGFAANIFLPIIAAKGPDDFRNCLTLTGEFSTGTGVADRYSFLTGGARFQALPNPGAAFIPPLYRPNIDNGLVTYDPDERLKTINWQAIVVGLQYYLPVSFTRIWVTGLYALLQSDNLRELTPLPDHGNIFTRSEYMDGSLFVGITPDMHLGVSLQVTDQSRGNGPKPRNIRAHSAINLFF